MEYQFLVYSGLLLLLVFHPRLWELALVSQFQLQSRLLVLKLKILTFLRSMRSQLCCYSTARDEASWRLPIWCRFDVCSCFCTCDVNAKQLVQCRYGNGSSCCF